MSKTTHIEQFITYLRAERQYSEKTILVYEPVLKAFCNFIDERRNEVEWKYVNSNDVREWVVEQMERGDSAATVNKRLSALRSFYKFMLMIKEVSIDPTRKVQGPKKEKKLPSFVREKEMDNLFDHLTFADDYKGERDRLILLLFYSTGIRLSELVGLNITSVDFYTSTIKVLGKRNKERIIPFGKELGDTLRHFIETRAQHLETASLPSDVQSSPALFVGEKGPRITTARVGKIVRAYLSQVTTIKKRSPHVLRHSFATAMLNNGAEIEVVKQLLGHESIATTEIYTHTTFEELKKVYAQAHPHADAEE